VACRVRAVLRRPGPACCERVQPYTGAIRGIGHHIFGHDGFGPVQFSHANRRRFQAHEVGFLDGHMRLRDRELYINSQCHGAAEVGRDTGQAVPSLRNYEGGKEKFQRIAQQGK
jgi:hypothetical protein